MKTKIEEKWTFETEPFTPGGGRLKLSGTKGKPSIRLMISQPDVGYGPNERGGSTASAEISIEDWEELVELVRKAQGSSKLIPV